VTLDVFYTGLDPQSAAVTVAAGQTVTRDFDLTSAARYGAGDVVRLDAFTVATARETDNDAIAVNEQRFAPNIKNVVAADSLGDVMDGNIGEFLKYVPGITPEYDYEDGTTVATVSIRGFAPHMVAVSNDGAQMANTSNAMGDSRAFSFNQASINNISRIEVAKVPTPANRADSLSGSVNMVSKSAFERKSMQFRYNLNLAANSENFSLRESPHTTDEKIYKLKSGGNFDLTLPLGPRFGIVMTGAASERYAKLHYSYKTYNANAAEHRRHARPALPPDLPPARLAPHARPPVHRPQGRLARLALLGSSDARRPDERLRVHPHRDRVHRQRRHQPRAHAGQRHALQLRPRFHDRRDRPRRGHARRRHLDAHHHRRRGRQPPLPL
jgi:outer membrane receptor protein involved in Fe transport